MSNQLKVTFGFDKIGEFEKFLETIFEMQSKNNLPNAIFSFNKAGRKQYDESFPTLTNEEVKAMPSSYSNKRYSCKICKELSDKDHKRGVVGRYLLSSMIEFNTENEAIKHLKDFHSKELGISEGAKA